MIVVTASSLKPVQPIEIESFEKKHQIKLHKDYVDFVSQYNGVYFGVYPYIMVEYNGVEYEVGLEQTIGFQDMRRRPYPREYIRDIWEDWNKFIAIGYIYEARFLYLGINPPVIGQVHIVPSWAPVKADGHHVESIKVANNFSEFLNLIQDFNEPQ